MQVNVAAKGDNKSIPDESTWKLSSNAKYVHVCDNETIGGVEFKHTPKVRVRVWVRVHPALRIVAGYRADWRGRGLPFDA